MSVEWTRRDIQRVQNEIQSLQKQIAEENRKESNYTDKILRVKSNINSNTSAFSLTSKYNEIERHEKDIFSSQKKRADFSKRLSEKTIQLHKLEKKLFDEQQKEQKNFQDNLERQRKEEQSRFQKEIKKLKNEGLAMQNRTIEQISVKEFIVNEISEEHLIEKNYDVFISHASEDKEDFVRPLAEKLIESGFSVWYDEFQLRIGDKLRRSIDKGLATSRFGIVVFSPYFFKKNWTQYELDGLVQREITGEKAILPLWHKVSKDEVMKFSPSLADTVALNTAMFTIDELVEKLTDVLK